MAGEDRLMDEILREHRLAEAVRGDEDHVLPLGEKVEGEDAFDAWGDGSVSASPTPNRPSA